MDEQCEKLALCLHWTETYLQPIAQLPSTDIVLHEIKTAANVPIRQRQFRHAPHLETQIDRQCKKTLTAGVITETRSESRHLKQLHFTD